MRLTFLKSISSVTSVPSVLWNSNVTTSSTTFDDIVSCTTSPPCNDINKKRNIKMRTQVLINYSVWNKIFMFMCSRYMCLRVCLRKRDENQ